MKSKASRIAARSITLLAAGLVLLGSHFVTPTQASAACPLPLNRTGLCASVTWDTAPSASRANAFTLRFWNQATGSESGPYITPGQTPFVRLWMSSMGHGSRPVVLSAAKDASGAPMPGVYRVEQVVFTMRGDWDVQIQLRNGATVVDQATLNLDL
jgi:hypothetical protein